MDRTVLNKVLGSALFITILPLTIAGLQFYGVINFSLGRACFVIVFIVGVAGILLSEWLWHSEVKTKILAGFFSIVIWALLVFSLDDWAREHAPIDTAKISFSKNTDAKPLPSAQPPPVVGKVTKRQVDPVVERNSQISVTFKDSPLFTEGRRVFIRNVIGKYQDYLRNAGLDPSSDVITLGVATPDGFGGCGSVHSSFPAPAYREGAIYIQENCLTKARDLTDLYSSWVFGKLLNSGTPGVRNDGLNRFAAQDIISDYYVASFENDPDFTWEGENSWPFLLWGMRKQFGKDFTDRSLAMAIRSMNEQTGENAKTSLDEYFCEHLGIGVSIIDNENRKSKGVLRFLQLRQHCVDVPATPL